jgi:hypothetical protein
MATIDWTKIAEEDRRRKAGVAALPLAAGAGGRARRAQRAGAGTPVQTPAHSMGGYPLAPLESRALGLPASGPAVDVSMPAAPGAGNAEAQSRGGVAPAAVSRLTSPAPRLFVDSDGIARSGFDMGADGRRLGLAPTDAGGVPVGIGMVPVQGLSQGSAEVGRDLRYGPPAPVVLAPPPAPPTTESYARAVNAIGGFKAPPMNAREAARQADLDATRSARWDQRGSTTRVDRAVGQIRSQGAALDALTRQTDERIREAQGTPQMEGAAGAGVMAWNPQTGKFDAMLDPPEQVKQVPVEERLQHLAAAIKAVSGGNVDPMSVMALNNIADPAEKDRRWRELTRGNPELAKQLSDYARALLPEYAQGGTGAPAAPGKGGGSRESGIGNRETGAGAQNAQAGAPAAGSAWDKYRRGNR